MLENNAKADTLGGEVTLTWRPFDPLRLEGAYGYVRINADKPSLPLHETTPPHQGAIERGMERHRNLELNTTTYAYRSGLRERVSEPLMIALAVIAITNCSIARRTDDCPQKIIRYLIWGERADALFIQQLGSDDI